jgi:hypothetical protein
MSNPRHLGRRLILRGFGGTLIALPLLEFTHGKAWAQTASTAAKRFVVFFEHGGYISNADKNGDKLSTTSSYQQVDGWKPAAEAENLVLGIQHQPLVGLEQELLLLRGIDNLACKHDSPNNGDHSWSNASALTHAKVTPSGEDYLAQGRSIDFELAERLQQRNPVPFPSINLAANAHNYGTPFFRAANDPVNGESNPKTAFDKLFANVATGAPTGPDPAVVRARALKKSVLDGTKEGLARFEKKVSAQDRLAVEAHLEHIRGIERTLADLPTTTAACYKPTVASDYGDYRYYDGQYFPKIAEAHADIIVAAFRCGLTNVATFNMQDFHATWMNPPYQAEFGIGHSLHHAAGDVGAGGSEEHRFDDWYKTIVDNRQYRSKVARRIIEGLRGDPATPALNLLRDSVVLWTSEFSCGVRHSVSDLPVMLAGQGGGLRTGRHLNFNLRAVGNPGTRAYATQSTLSNLYASILQLFGYEDTSFGNAYPSWTEDSYVVTKAVSGGLPGLT